MDMDKKDMLERVVKAARRAYMKGFAAGSGGNVSIRIQRQVYISPSGICLGDLTAEDMIMLEADGFPPSIGEPDAGSRRPSKEAGMHLACYRSRPDILCLFHLHSPLFHCSCLPQTGRQRSGHGDACLHSGIRHARGKDTRGSLLPSGKQGTG